MIDTNEQRCPHCYYRLPKSMRVPIMGCPMCRKAFHWPHFGPNPTEELPRVFDRLDKAVADIKALWRLGRGSYHRPLVEDRVEELTIAAESMVSVTKGLWDLPVDG